MPAAWLPALALQLLLLLLLSPLTPTQATLTQTVWPNSALAGPGGATSEVAVPGGSWPGRQLLSAEWLGVLTPPAAGDYTLTCQTRHGAVLLWLDDHLLCGTDELFAPLLDAPLPPFMRLSGGKGYILRAQFYHNETSVDNASLALMWSERGSGGAPTPIPPSAFAAGSVPPEQRTRLELQRRLATGWGAWWRPSALAATLLPEAATLTAGLCTRGSGCMDPCAPFTQEQGRAPEEPRSPGVARPGIMAWDHSYWELTVGFGGVNVSLEWWGSGSGGGAAARESLSLLATVVGGDASGASLMLSADFKFDRAGVVSADSVAGLTLVHGLPHPEGAAPGMRTVRMRAVGSGSGSAQVVESACNTSALRLPLGKDGAGFTSAAGPLPSLGSLRAQAVAARTRALVKLRGEQKGLPELEEAVEAMQVCDAPPCNHFDVVLLG